LRTARSITLLAAACLAAACLATGTARALPRVPVPIENPVTEPKRVLGKILFWDEQLAADNTVACGTCHRPAQGGADPRAGRNPGVDPGTIDDVLGSPGIASLDEQGRSMEHPDFGRDPQVTARLAPSNFGALWADALFWDGRAGPQFLDPLTGVRLIARHGALEAQAAEALSNPAEMTHAGHAWAELTDKLARAAPLALATDLPPDVAQALIRSGDYPTLFAAAFGDSAITPARIAFAIATYERTLVADRTPWDRYQAGDDTALSTQALYGWRDFQSLRCVNCHLPPLFTDDRFFNTGVRLTRFDRGRQAVTGRPEDAGDMKVPSLRNVGLRPRFMHTGQFPSLGTAIGFYRTGAALEDRDSIPNAGTYTFNMSSTMEQDLRTFLEQALTDARVRDERFPFDRPRLRSERQPQDVEPPAVPTSLVAQALSSGAVLRWREPEDDTGVVDYVVERNGRVVGLTTRPELIDENAPRGEPLRYRVIARDAAANRSEAAELDVTLSPDSRALPRP
jgi:cytochrome c peroxidase